MHIAWLFTPPLGYLPSHRQNGSPTLHPRDPLPLPAPWQRSLAPPAIAVRVGRKQATGINTRGWRLTATAGLQFYGTAKGVNRSRKILHKTVTPRNIFLLIRGHPHLLSVRTAGSNHYLVNGTKPEQCKRPHWPATWPF